MCGALCEALVIVRLTHSVNAPTRRATSGPALVTTHYWDGVIVGPWGWPRSTAQARVPAQRKRESRPVAYYPSRRVGNAQYASRVNFQLRNATPRWSVSHDAPQATADQRWGSY